MINYSYKKLDIDLKFKRHNSRHYTEDKAWAIPLNDISDIELEVANFRTKSYENSIFSDLLFSNRKDSIEKFSITNLKGHKNVQLDYSLDVYVNPNTSVLYRHNDFNQVYTLYYNGGESETGEIITKIYHNKDLPGHISFIDYKNKSINYIIIDVENGNIIESIDDISFEILSSLIYTYPNKYRITKFKDFYFEINKYGINTVYKKIGDDKIKYSKKWLNSKDSMNFTIYNKCYCPIIFNKNGLLYLGEGKGFAEFTTLVVKNGEVVEVDQIITETTEEIFLKTFKGDNK